MNIYQGIPNIKMLIFCPYTYKQLWDSYLKSSCQEFVLNLQEISFTLFTLEGFINNLESGIILNILPSTITMTFTR